MKRISLIGLMSLLVGCASERVVLLPSADGRPSAVIVQRGDKSSRLDQPYATAERRLGFNRETTLNAEEVQARYGKTLAARPPRPASFNLYFQENTTLTPESQLLLGKIQAEIRQRKAAELEIIGHTDRVGSVEKNDALSLRRATSTKALFLEMGIADHMIQISGRGEREPLIPTADEVLEPRNRRVQITVR